LLDISTLAVVQKKVADCARDWRSAYRCLPISRSMAADSDPRMTRVDELESLGRWLDEQLALADAQEVA
jgi:hypothetical protein